MTHDEFLGQVQARARLASGGEAERATRATLETLAERMSSGAAANLAAQLPHEIGEHLRRMSDGTVDLSGAQLSFDEFLDRVAEREGVEKPEAAFHIRCVLEVVGEATTPGLLGKVREQFPSEFSRLFDAGSQGAMPRS